jgi:hypothetical protein
MLKRCLQVIPKKSNSLALQREMMVQKMELPFEGKVKLGDWLHIVFKNFLLA